MKYCDPSGHSGLLVGQIAATSIMAVLNHADTIFIMGVISGVINTAMVKVMGGDDNEQIKAFWKGFTVGALIGTLTCFVAYVTTISIIQAGAIVGVGYGGYDIAVDLFVKHDYEGAAAKIPFLIFDVLVLKRSFTINTLLPGYDGHKGSIGEYNKKNTEYPKESITEGNKTNGIINGKTPASRLADKVRRLPNSKRPNTVAVVRTADGRYYIGYNKAGVNNAEVQNILDSLENTNIFNRQCAEVNAISRAINDGANLDGETISVANVRSVGNYSGLHGTSKPPCDVCQPLLDYYGIEVVN